MGEPLTKSALHLFACACESIAAHRFAGKDWHVPLDLPWRAFAVGGDDHIAYGPKDYLDSITENMVASGAIISIEKHGISSIGVKYCEKFLDLRHITQDFDPRSVPLNDAPVYERHPAVDSVKVRLLSPEPKGVRDVADDRNVAFGKGGALSAFLRWLPRSHYTTKWLCMVRDRFCVRMRAKFPPRGSKLWYQCLLPPWLGGLSLWLEEDLDKVFKNLPLPTQYLLMEIERRIDWAQPNKRILINPYVNESDPLRRVFQIFRSFVTKNSFREWADAERFGRIISDSLTSSVPHLDYIGAIVLFKKRNQGPMVGDEDQVTQMRRQGLVPEYEVIDMALRAGLFSAILSGQKTVTRAFHTQDWDTKYRKLWDGVKSSLGFSWYGEYSMSTDHLTRIIRDADLLLRLYDLSEVPKKPLFVQVQRARARGRIEASRVHESTKSMREQLTDQTPSLRLDATVLEFFLF